MKFLFKLLLIGVAIYILMQVPFVREQVEGLKAALFEKAENVTEEVDRVKDQVDQVRGQVENIKEKIGNARDSYNELKGQVIQTKDALEGAANKLNKAMEAFSGEEDPSEEEAAPNSP